LFAILSSLEAPLSLLEIPDCIWLLEENSDTPEKLGFTCGNFSSFFCIDEFIFLPFFFFFNLEFFISSSSSVWSFSSILSLCFLVNCLYEWLSSAFSGSSLLRWVFFFLFLRTPWLFALFLLLSIKGLSTLVASLPRLSFLVSCICTLRFDYAFPGLLKPISFLKITLFLASNLLLMISPDCSRIDPFISS